MLKMVDTYSKLTFHPSQNEVSAIVQHITVCNFLTGITEFCGAPTTKLTRTGKSCICCCPGS